MPRKTCVVRFKAPVLPRRIGIVVFSVFALHGLDSWDNGRAMATPPNYRIIVLEPPETISETNFSHDWRSQ
jgi:hypothetical protein